jgi:hypothetical protein
MQAVEADKPFEVNVIATKEKKVPARADELINRLKIAAMDRFGIPESKASEYRLATEPGNPHAELDDNKTCADYGLHEGSTLYLVKPHNDA